MPTPDSTFEYPSRLMQREAELLERRRATWHAAGEPTAPAKAGKGAAPYVGLALSGGGLRSATFSLGLLQALARCKLLRHVDYLSTVSGGSYIGGFLGTLYHRLGVASGLLGPRRPAAVEEELGDPRSKVVDWLRQNGRYLAPGGAADGWAALAVILRNLVAVNLVTWTLVLTLFLALDLLRAVATRVAGGVLPSLPGPGGIVWWSPYLAIPAAIAALAVVPLGLAYWIVPGRRHGGSLASRGRGPAERARSWLRRWRVSLFSAVVVPALAALALFLRVELAPRSVSFAPPWQTAGWQQQPGTIVVAAAGGLVIVAWAWLALARVTAAKVQNDGSQPMEPLQRFKLSGWLRAWLLLFSITLLGAIVDSLGQTAYRALADKPFRGALVGSLVGAVSGFIALGAGVQKVIGLVGVKKAGVGVPLRLVALAGALVLLAPILVGLSAVGHGIVWQWAVAGPLWEPSVQLWGWPSLTFFLLALLSALFGRTYPFLNDSSIASLYASRLTRAYVGASNDRRDQASELASTDLLPEDVIPLADYAPHAGGGPLHIINTTLNETIGGQSQVEERDRKGMILAVGPAGVSVGARHHAVWRSERPGELESTDTVADKGFRVFPRGEAQAPRVFRPERLELGRWMAISGAAASTALGSMTSLGLSLLCGLLNVRLGHWWWSDVDPQDRATAARPGVLRRIELMVSRWLPVQTHLFHELSARFPGTGTRNWYLTDGGHFENTGAYELLRRKLTAIILVDNGADKGRVLGDMANLVRKARVDLDTHIEFVDPSKVTAPTGGGRLFDVACLGKLEELGFDGAAAAPPGAPLRYAALARITYGSGGGAAEGWLLLVKPGLMGDEPLDVREYRKANPDFPQQTTADQFFDEAQWEAYRKLGEHIGTRLFDGTNLAAGLGIVA